MFHDWELPDPIWSNVMAEEKRTQLVPIVTPDETPSHSRCQYAEDGRYLRALIEIKDDYGRRLGALLITVEGDEETGRLGAEGVAAFSQEEIYGR